MRRCAVAVRGVSRSCGTHARITRTSHARRVACVARVGRCQPCVSAHQLHTDATHCGAGERPGGAGGDGGEASRPRGSVQAEEVAKFTSHAAEWWDPLSKTFGPLHSMNAVRVPFIRRAVAAAARARDASAEGPGHAGTGSGAARGGHALAGVTVLDAGCGGGVLAESLARVGATVTGVDPGEQNIQAAQAHAALDPRLGSRLTYKVSTVEDLAATGAQFDVVVSSEVVEHVTDVPGFVAACGAMVKPGGVAVFTTLNRTTVSHVVAITLAERVFGLLPNGTHEWAKFVTPEELQRAAQAAGLRSTEVVGFRYNPIMNRWWQSSDTSINYGMAAVKPVASSTSAARSR